MFLKVATTVTLIASCLGHAPAYDERGSNEAISTQSFNRDDIPISYKYTAIHVYSTQKPLDDDDVIRPQKHDPRYHVIQYAPLIDNTSKNSTRFTKVVLEANDAAKKPNIEIKNDKLEPRKHPARVSDAPKYKYFVPGHNIEVKRSPNRNLGQTAVYQSELENMKDIYNEVTYNSRENMKNEDAGVGPLKLKEPNIEHDLKQEPFAWMFDKNLKPNTYMFYKAETKGQPNKLNPLPTHHTHRMHINVARMNGQAQVIAREIVIGDILKNLGIPLRHPNIKGGIRLNGEQKTLLYPTRQQPYH